MSFSIDEWFVITLARTIRNREVVFHGFGSPCAQVAMHVGRTTFARDTVLVEGAMYAINPDPPFIPPTSNDASLQRGAAYRMRIEEFFDAAARGDVDRMFLSGGQIDRYGNINTTVIGDYASPKVRLPGAGGAPEIAAAVNGHLFGDLGFRGNSVDYGDPANSYLDRVLERRTGLPITLSVVYLEVGWRLGLPVASMAWRFLPVFRSIAERHPNLRLIIDHCGLVRSAKDEAAFANLDELLSLAKLPNIAVKATGAPAYSSQPYPFRNIHDGLRRIFDAFGPHRFFWGTDITRMPCSYRQCVTMFTEELHWLSGQDLELVMGRAVCEWLGWKLPFD